MLLRNAVPTHEPAARLRADELLRWESAAHLDPERTLNTALAGLRPLAVAADYYYATAHFLVVIAVPVWAARRAPGAARRLRAVFYTLNGLGLAGFWLFPLAPPRLHARRRNVRAVSRSRPRRLVSVCHPFEPPLASIHRRS